MNPNTETSSIEDEEAPKNQQETSFIPLKKKVDARSQSPKTTTVNHISPNTSEKNLSTKTSVGMYHEAKQAKTTQKSLFHI